MALSLEAYRKGAEVAKKRISDIVLRTPLLKSNWLSKQTSCNVYLKMESEQITRSFKLRGATNKLKMIAEKKSGSDRKVVTASTGNHGLGCAYVSSLLNINTVVYTYMNVAKVKEDEITQYPNVELIKFGSESSESETEARKQANEQGLTFISPYNDNDVICGQGTIGLELLEQLPELDAIIIPVGGGGLVAGIATYIKACKPSIKIIGVQPVNDSSMLESVKKGYILTDNPIKDTFSSGTAGRIEPGSVTFDLCQKYVDDWVLLEEEEIELAVFEMLCKEKKIIEGAAGLTVAAMKKVAKQYENKNVALIICGGNIGVSEIKRLSNKYC